MARQEFRIPMPAPNMTRSERVAERKQKFEPINRLARSCGGWPTSIPGAIEVTMECLPDSRLPDDLRALGYDVSEIGEGERILHSAIVERIARRADCELEVVTAHSTRPIAETRRHAGIVRVKCHAFKILSAH